MATDMKREFKPIESQRVLSPINEMNFDEIKRQNVPFLRRKSDLKILSNSIKTEDIITKDEIDKLKEDIAKKEEITKRNIEKLEKDFQKYKIETEIEMLYKDRQIKELKEKIKSLESQLDDKLQTIVFLNEKIKRQNKIINEKTQEYMKNLNEENKKIDQEYSKAIARIVHDMKNPLTGIKGGLEVLLENENKDEYEKQILRIIYNSTIELSNMIEEILINNKFVHGFVELKKEETNLSEQIKEIYEFLTLPASLTSKKVSMYCQENVIITCDKGKIKRAISNIALNALKYSKSHVSIGITEDENEVRIVIIDDGEGFDEEIKRKVLSNKDMNTTDLINGNGFGLTNAKRIVEMHNGKLFIESNENNVGTKVTIKLPKK